MPGYSHQRDSRQPEPIEIDLLGPFGLARKYDRIRQLGLVYKLTDTEMRTYQKNQDLLLAGGADTVRTVIGFEVLGEFNDMPNVLLLPRKDLIAISLEVVVGANIRGDAVFEDCAIKINHLEPVVDLLGMLGQIRLANTSKTRDDQHIVKSLSHLSFLLAYAKNPTRSSLVMPLAIGSRAL